MVKIVALWGVFLLNSVKRANERKNQIFLQKPLQLEKSCATISLGCKWLVYQAAQAMICVDAGGCRFITGFSAEYVRSRTGRKNY